VGSISAVREVTGDTACCRVEAEISDLDPEILAAEVTRIIERLTDAANMPDCERDLDVVLERGIDPFTAGRHALRLARTVLADHAETVSAKPCEAGRLAAAGFDSVGVPSSCDLAALLSLDLSVR
jgi:hypothetical protein